MKLFLNLQNNRINLLNLLDLKLWELMYTLNLDIIEKYNPIKQTDTMLEYIFQFKPLSIFPPFYSHMIINKNNNTFTTKTLETPPHLKCINCVKLQTKSETIDITGTEHDVCIELNLELHDESKILEPAIKNIFKKIFARIKTYIESL